MGILRISVDNDQFKYLRIIVYLKLLKIMTPLKYYTNAQERIQYYLSNKLYRQVFKFR